MKNMKSYIKILMSTMSDVECLYQSLNVNDLTMNECLSTRKVPKNSKTLSIHITYHNHHIL